LIDDEEGGCECAPEQKNEKNIRKLGKPYYNNFRVVVLYGL
jgi:hypothetical protein